MSTHVRKFGRLTQTDVTEPALAELLDDPVLQILMDRDHVDRERLERLIRETRERLGLAGAGLPPAVPDILFADCRS